MAAAIPVAAVFETVRETSVSRLATGTAGFKSADKDLRKPAQEKIRQKNNGILCRRFVRGGFLSPMLTWCTSAWLKWYPGKVGAEQFSFSAQTPLRTAKKSTQQANFRDCIVNLRRLTQPRLGNSLASILLVQVQRWKL